MVKNILKILKFMSKNQKKDYYEAIYRGISYLNFIFLIPFKYNIYSQKKEANRALGLKN